MRSLLCSPGSSAASMAPGRGCREGFGAETQFLQEQIPQKRLQRSRRCCLRAKCASGERLAGEAEAVLPTQQGYGTG